MSAQRWAKRGRRVVAESREAEATLAPGAVMAIREHPRRPGRYLLEVGDTTLGPVSAEVIGSHGIRLGVALDESALMAIAAAARRIACYDRASGALGRRARSTEELRRWLRERECEAADIDDALERLTSLGLLDDLAFARGFAHSRTVGRGYGSRRVAAELARRGVAAGIIATMIGELREEGGGDETAAIEQAARRRLRSVGGLEPEVARRRLLGWLVRRGFSVGESLKVVRGLVPVRSASGGVR